MPKKVMAKRKTLKWRWNLCRQLLELESESDSEDNWFVDSVYDSDDNDAPFIPEDLSSSSDSNS